MQSTEFNKLEQALCDWISVNTGDPDFTRQLEAASVKRRDYTRTGFFVYLDTPADCETIATSVRPSCPQIIGPELPYGAGCNLFLKNGRLHYLEIYTRGGFMPESLEQFRLQTDA